MTIDMERRAWTRRGLMASLAAAAATPATAAALAADGFDAVVSADPAERGGRVFRTVGAAVAAAPGDRPFQILVRRGVWREKLTVDRPDVRLRGEGRGVTVLTYDAYAGQRDPNGKTWGTSGSCSVTVTAPGFQARDLTLANGFDYNRDREGSGGAQAVALGLVRDADKAVLERVDLTGYQDTLLVNGPRAVFRDCLISGGVDFIFGGGRALFAGCEIRSRFTPGKVEQGYLAAPSTPRGQPFGLVFDHCRLTREAALPDGSVYLGRPWRAGGDPNRRGAAAFLDCWMDRHIAEVGWTQMGFSAPNGQRLFLRPEEARFSEFHSRGPGARQGPGRFQLTAREAAAYRPTTVLDGWTGRS
ncbi:MAG: pectinesterase [Caulobacter sp.]|nr:pectinesterase [Caulobacter sp.]